MGEASSSHGLVLKPISHQDSSRGSTSHGTREQNTRASTGHGVREHDSRASTSHAPREFPISNEHAFASSRAKQSENLRGSQNLSAADLAQKNLNSLLRESTANGIFRSRLSFCFELTSCTQVILPGSKGYSKLAQIPLTSMKLRTRVLSPSHNPETAQIFSSNSTV
jgi:hypothetical protein